MKLFTLCVLACTLLSGCATCQRHADACRVAGAVAVVAVGFAVVENVHITGGPPVVRNPAPPTPACTSPTCYE